MLIDAHRKLIRSLVILLAFVPLTLSARAVPPQFAKSPDGSAANGQTVSDGTRSRVQRIAVLPDRTTGRDWGVPYLQAAVEDLNIIRPDAVFTVGDMVQGYTRVPETWQKEVEEYQTIVNGLSATFYPTAGNHDVISGSRTAGDRTFSNLYQKNFGPLWYSVDLELATAIILFSDEGLGDGNIQVTDQQFQWLKVALDHAKQRGKPIFMLMHRPLWRYTAVKWQERIHPLLVAAGVDAVIAGHFHALQRDPDLDGIQYHIVGTCGGMIDQHPLAGQLQHLTFIDCTSEGALRVWHQPVGLVLPDDFVTRVDQDRVLLLREPKPAIRALGTLPDPSTLREPTSFTVKLLVNNPIDLPIQVTLDAPGVIRMPDGPPLWWTAGRAGRGTPGTTGGINGWTSHVLADIDNASTMASNSRSPVRVAAGACHGTVAAKSESVIEFPVTLLPQTSVMPPQLEMFVTFQDSKGRTVPIYLPTRLPIERTLSLKSELEKAPTIPILAWNYSPYDTREENPSLRIASLPSNDRLILEVTVPDSTLAAAPEWSVPDAKRMKNPHADAVRVVMRSDSKEPLADFLVEPFTTGAAAPKDVLMKATQLGTQGWVLRLDIPLPTEFVQGNKPLRLQVGVADNDNTFHTQWRWLAPLDEAGGWQIDRK